MTGWGFVTCVLLIGLEPTATEVDFDTEIMPIFTRGGCNAGACHGAAIGRGGFHLSLLGGDPERDYQTIVHEFEGRRVDLARPEASLILAKPTGKIAHEGGIRLNSSGEASERLRTWLRAGAPRGERRRLVDFEVDPGQRVVARLDQEIPLRTIARFDDGTVEDVTRWTVFTARDPEYVDIQRAGDQASAHFGRAGQNLIIARYLDRVMPLEIIVPIGRDPVDHSTEMRVNEIDTKVLALLEDLRLPVSLPVG